MKTKTPHLCLCLCAHNQYDLSIDMLLQKLNVLFSCFQPPQFYDVLNAFPELNLCSNAYFVTSASTFPSKNLEMCNYNLFKRMDDSKTKWVFDKKIQPSDFVVL